MTTFLFGGETVVINAKPHAVPPPAATVIEPPERSRQGIFTDSLLLSIPKRPARLCGAAGLLCTAYRGCFPLGLRPRCKAERLPLSSDGIKNK